LIHMVQKRHAYRVLVGKPDGWRPLGGHVPRWQDNIKMAPEGSRMGRCESDEAQDRDT